jgi:hypothetical protein
VKFLFHILFAIIFEPNPIPITITITILIFTLQLQSVPVQRQDIALPIVRSLTAAAIPHSVLTANPYEPHYTSRLLLLSRRVVVATIILIMDVRKTIIATGCSARMG